MTPMHSPHRPSGLPEPDAWKSGTSGSEGAGAQQCAPATRRWRIQRHRKRGTNRRYIDWYPSRKAVKAITGKVKILCRRMDTNEPLDALLRQLNPALRGWCNYFRPGMSARTFCYLSSYLWGRVIAWLRRKHRWTTWKDLRRRYCGGRWWPSGQEFGDVQPRQGVRTTGYRYRGVIGIPSPWPTEG